MIAIDGKMTLTINQSNYLKLLDEMQLIPKVIETEAEYEQNLAVVEKLIAKKNQRTPEETTTNKTQHQDVPILASKHISKLTQSRS